MYTYLDIYIYTYVETQRCVCTFKEPFLGGALTLIQTEWMYTASVGKTHWIPPRWRFLQGSSKESEVDLVSGGTLVPALAVQGGTEREKLSGTSGFLQNSAGNSAVACETLRENQAKISEDLRKPVILAPFVPFSLSRLFPLNVFACVHACVRACPVFFVRDTHTCS